MLLTLYRGLTDLSAPALRLLLARRRAQGKEDPARLGERMGLAGLPRPDGALVWLHGASVGEAVSLLPVIERLRAERPALSVLCTTGTVTSATLLAERLPPEVTHQFVPMDRLAWVRRFLDHWRPDLALIAESELWPNLLAETARRGTPMALLNGRMSLDSYRGWRRYGRGLIRRLMGISVLCWRKARPTPSACGRLAPGPSSVRAI